MEDIAAVRPLLFGLICAQHAVLLISAVVLGERSFLNVILNNFFHLFVNVVFDFTVILIGIITGQWW
jgi:hypothetical protein